MKPEERLQQLKNELKRRANNRRIDILSTSFKEQTEFIKDKSKRKALFVPRRGGKSYAIGMLLLWCALKHSGIKLIYLALTKDGAHNILWNDILQRLLIKHRVKHKFNKSTKTIELSNRSTIKLTGGDVSPGEVRKLLGGKYFMVVIDECGAYKQKLSEIVQDHLEPAVSDYISKDYGGTIVLAGTPADDNTVRQGKDDYFYQITRKDKPSTEWKLFSWFSWENPYMADAVRLQFDKFKTEWGDGYMTQPWFRRQWLCEWVLSADQKVYAYEPLRNNIPIWHSKGYFEGHPAEMRELLVEQYRTDLGIMRSIDNIDKQWHYVIGIDLGFQDATAVVVGAFCLTDKTFYIVDSFKRRGMHYKELADYVSVLMSKYHPDRIVCDTGAGGAQAVAEMNRTYRLPIRAAAKEGLKHVAIGRMNADMMTGKLKVIRNNSPGKGRNAELVDEWEKDVWDPEVYRTSGKRVELRSCENHLSDACLYAYRASYHYASDPEAITPEMDTVTAWRRQLKKSGIPFNPTEIKSFRPTDRVGDAAPPRGPSVFEELPSEAEVDAYLDELFAEEQNDDRQY